MKTYPSYKFTLLFLVAQKSEPRSYYIYHCLRMLDTQNWLLLSLSNTSVCLGYACILIRIIAYLRFFSASAGYRDTMNKTASYLPSGRKIF